jgi:hypothetical protein
MRDLGREGGRGCKGRGIYEIKKHILKNTSE